MKRRLRALVVGVLIAVGFCIAGPGWALASAPQYQRVANLSDRSAIISWDTATAEAGRVNYGTSCGTNGSGLTMSAGPDNTSMHAIVLSGLSPATTYYYDIVSGGQTTYAPNGGCFSFTTLPGGLIPPPPITVTGKVFTDPSCSTAVTAGLVMVTDSRTGATSGMNQTPINGTASGIPGTYAVVLSPAAASDSSGWFAPKTGDTITVTADNGTARQTITAVWDGSSNPVNMADLCISMSAVTIQAGAGWNMVGGSPFTLWPDSQITTSWNAFTGQWIQPTSSSPLGTGAWEYVTTTGPHTVTVLSCGGPVSIPVLHYRWNMVGNPCSVSVTLPSTARAYWWNPSLSRYVLVTSINPGAAAWVKPLSNPLVLTPSG